MMKYASFLVLALGILIAVFGCTTSSIYDVDDENFGVINDEAWLYTTQVEPSGEELTSKSKAWGGISLSLKEADFFIMYKVAHINSPTLDGNTLQATDVAIVGDGDLSYAYVTYAMAGDSFYGGTDILQLRRGYFPKLKSRLLTKKEDVNSVTYDSSTNKLFLGLHVDPDVYGLTGDYHGAYLRSVELNTDKKIKVNAGSLVTKGVPLHSYAANDAAIMDDEVLVPVGAVGGGVEIRSTGDITDENVAKFINNLNDTRAVATYYDSNGDVAGFLVYQGPDHATPTLYKCDTSGNYIDSLPIENPVPEFTESKSTIEVHGNVAFVAASDGGVYAIDIDDNMNMKILFNIANPDPDLYGLTDDKVTANDVTVGKLKGSDKSVIFIANGEYGVRAFKLDFDIDNVNDVASALSEYEPSSHYLGNVHLGTGNSANSVLYRNGYLFVGTGLGGLNVLYVVDFHFPSLHGKPHWSTPSLR